jgi:thiol:disulfide interchange protein DsbD
MLKRIGFFIFLFLFTLSAFSKTQEPVRWKVSLNSAGEILFAASIEAGWHIYDIALPPGGPNPTTFTFESVEGAELKGKPSTSTPLKTEYDAMFEMNVSWYAGSPVFVQPLKITDSDRFRISGYIDFMSCNDEACTFGKEEFSFSKKDLPTALASVKPSVKEPEGKTEELLTKESVPEKTGLSADSTLASAVTSPEEGTSDLWSPVIDQLQQGGTGETASNKSWLQIFLLCFAGGFVALLTPCVWPIIPMTVSFFLKRSKTNRKKAVVDALTYGLSIIVIYLVLGLLITALFGASALNDLSTNALFNILFFALLVLFAVSFFGAFELALPSSWSNRIDSKADSTTGLISIFFMAFTLVLVSFSCTGPIIGTLLVQAAGMGNITGPAIGMFGFGLALAIPFALFAIFPSWLQNLPKSGGWLNSVKVVLGFLELALALKFLSVADLAYGWRLLDREVFLVLWIIIFVLLGLYLLGKIRFPHDSELKQVSVTRLFLSIFSFAFAVYMLPGLWGAPLKAISAFPPPLYTQDFNLYSGEVHPQFSDYGEGMKYAQKHKKPVMIDFTGFGCVNCREMDAAVWSDPRVKGIIDNDYVLISLYVDDKTKLPEIIEVEEYGKMSKLRTVGDRWSYLQRHKFGANAQPFYVLLDNRGNPLAPSRAYNKSIEENIAFLKKGMEQYNQVK